MKSFWNGNHELTPLYNKLWEYVPVMGQVAHPYANPKLERLRKVSGAYRDLFNNGGCNRARAIARYFGAEALACARERLWDAAMEIMDPIVAQAVKEAAVEQYGTEYV